MVTDPAPHGDAARPAETRTAAARSVETRTAETRTAEASTAARRATVRSTKPTLSEHIRDGLVELIVSGKLESGARLVETKIAADFGTSQAPVREALRELEGLGLIESRPRHGRHVLPFVEQTLREAYVVRAALEEAATRLALTVGRIPWDAMGEDVADMYRSAEGEDLHAMRLASTRFHRRVVQASGNFLLERAWEGLQIEARTAIALVVAGPELRHVADEHAELLEVLRTGDVETACLHTRLHQWSYADLPHDMHGGTADHVPTSPGEEPASVI